MDDHNLLVMAAIDGDHQSAPIKAMTNNDADW